LRLTARILIWSFLSSVLVLSSANAAVILVSEEVLRDYKLLVGNLAPTSVRDFRGQGSSRQVAEVILLLQALDAGGYRREIRLRTSPSNAQTLRTLVAGEAHLSGTTRWKQELQKFEPRINPSFALLRAGEFQMGLFGCRGQLKLGVPTLNELSIVADRSRSVEWSALKQAHFKAVDSSDSELTRVRMVCLGRVDATVAEFPAASELSIHRGGFTLEAYPEIKLTFEDTRHYPISKVADRSQAVTMALNRGLRVIRRKGLVTRAMLHSGFHHPKTKGWQEVKLRSNK